MVANRRLIGRANCSIEPGVIGLGASSPAASTAAALLWVDGVAACCACRRRRGRARRSMRRSRHSALVSPPPVDSQWHHSHTHTSLHWLRPVRTAHACTHTDATARRRRQSARPAPVPAGGRRSGGASRHLCRSPGQPRTRGRQTCCRRWGRRGDGRPGLRTAGFRGIASDPPGRAAEM